MVPTVRVSVGEIVLIVLVLVKRVVAVKSIYNYSHINKHRNNDKVNNFNKQIKLTSKSK